MAAIFINRNNLDRVFVCVFWLAITLTWFLIEWIIGREIAQLQMDKTGSLYLWIVTFYYIAAAMANVLIVFYIAMSTDSDYEWLFYPIILVVILNILIPIELIFGVSRITYRAYKEMAEIINGIEIILLVMDNHGNRTRIKQFVANRVTAIHWVPLRKALLKFTDKEKV